MKPKEMHLILLHGFVLLLLGPGVSSTTFTKTSENEIYVQSTTQKMFFKGFSGSSLLLKSASLNVLTDAHLHDQHSQHSNEIFDTHRLDTSKSHRDTHRLDTSESRKDTHGLDASKSRKDTHGLETSNSRRNTHRLDTSNSLIDTLGLATSNSRKGMHRLDISNSRKDTHRWDTSNSHKDMPHQLNTEKDQPIFTQRKMFNKETKYSSSSCYSFQEDQGIGINCSSLNLDHIPDDLPRNMYDLIFSNNMLRALNISSLFVYPKLAHLNVASNRIGQMINIPGGRMSLYLKTLVLDTNFLIKLPEHIFENLSFLEILSIKDNKIQSLSNLTFVGLFQLITLDVSYNKIKFIEAAAFDHMPKLRVLHLNHNWCLGYNHKHFPPRLFMNLKSLKKLYLQGISNKATTYPNEALGYLRNLSHLAIDGLNDKIILGSPVRNLTKLESLQISDSDPNTFYKQTYDCHIQNITEDFFMNLPYLTTVKFIQCPIRSISPHAFTHIPNLKHLSIVSSRFLGLIQAFSSLKALQNSSLVSLSLIRLLDEHFFPCLCLRGEDAKYISNLKLEFLDLSSNHLALIQTDFYTALPQTLKSLILRDNKFTTDTFKINMLTSLKNLEKLDLTSQNIQHSFIFPFKPLQIYTDHNEQVSSDHIYHKQQLCWKHEIDNYFSQNTKSQDSQPHTDIQLEDKIDNHESLRLPPYVPKLKVLWAPSFRRWLFLDHNSIMLEEIDFSHNMLYLWGTEPTRLPMSVKNASFVGNYCRRIEHYFFPKHNSLISLNISNNLLGPQFANDSNGDIFCWLSKVQNLDIAMNVIDTLPHRFLKGLTNLKSLILSDNRLQGLNLTLSHMKNLEVVDARRNSITWIGREMRYDLDVLALNHTVSLDLRENPLRCTCDGLEILSWLKNTKILLVRKHLLKCRFENGHHGYIGNMTQRFNLLQRKCRPKWVKLLPWIVSLCAIMVAVMIFVIFRLRWKIKYLAVVKLSKLLRFQNQTATNYKFDAYIVYAEEDRDFVRDTIVNELETKRKHRLCVVGRDFIPGSIINADITLAIQSSNRTIPVISPEFFGDENVVSIQMALCEERYAKRSVLELFMYKHVEENDIKSDLLVVLKNNKFVTYPEDDIPDDRIREGFWDSLSETIGHTDNQCEPRHEFN